ncbi:hypothetical protein [Desulfosporosinus sp. OT]|nr:hypothetical protein [Desulfosporosinus sp. OT]EGW41877.1 hypothetical protein DOT_0176 [Desulfosporosinus sp. OT]
MIDLHQDYMKYFVKLVETYNSLVQQAFYLFAKYVILIQFMRVGVPI